MIHWAASGIYQIKNQINQKRYVGSAVNLRKRWQTHLSRLRQEQHRNQHLQCAFDKYGEDTFAFEVLEHVEDISQLIVREQHFFDTLNPEYNILSTAGSPLGHSRSLETRRKISEAQRGERGNNFGKHASAETRAKMSAAHKGKPHPHCGHHPSEETRKKISDSEKGKRISEETRRKLSVALSGERHPNYGKHHSEDARRNMSEAQKERWRKIRAAKARDKAAGRD